MTAPWNALHPILDAIPDPACCHAMDAVAVVEAEGSGAMGRSISKLSGGYGHAKADSIMPTIGTETENGRGPVNTPLHAQP